MEAIKIHGPFFGTLIGLKRILRCNPFGGSGFDPVQYPKSDSSKKEK
jgi:putative component of membrane protein insertase Oxa1/YidC/SpoIIIJ protein YidD